MSSYFASQYVDPNPFGNGIEFREGEPIWLARYIEKSDHNPDGKVELNQEALDILANIWEPVAVIAIVGAYRRGKSWFANVLHGRHDGFALGSYVDGCTKGLWMWSQPFLHNDMRVIVLDSEGLDDPDQDQDWATKLFLLCLTLSSTFIYNIPGVLNAADVNKLYIMNDLQKFVQPPNDEIFLPRLVILLRDFYLKHKTEPSQYFMQTLTKVNPTAAEGIKKNFKDFDIYSLPMPGCKTDVLQNMDQARNAELDDTFVNSAANIVKDIFQKISSKYINDRPMPGAAFCNFLQDVVKTINSPLASIHLSIPDVYEKTIQFVARKAIEDGLDYYHNEMRDILSTDTLPVSWDDFNVIHTRAFSGALQSFDDKAIGTQTEDTKFTDDFQTAITDAAGQYNADNSKALKKQIETVYSQHWTFMVKERLQLGMANAFESHDELENALKEFELECTQNVIDCPEMDQVLRMYRTVNYTEACTRMHFLQLYNEQKAKIQRLELEQKQQAQQHANALANINNQMAKNQQEAQERIRAINNQCEMARAELERTRQHISNLEKQI